MSFSDQDYQRQTNRLQVGASNRPGQVPLHAPADRYDLYRTDQTGRRWGLLITAVIVVALLAGAAAWAIRADHLSTVATGGDRVIALCFPSNCAPLLGTLPTTAPAEVATSLTDAIGLHVCSPRQFSPHTLGCLGDLTRFSIRHLRLVHLSVTGYGGAPFTHPTLTLMLARQLPHQHSEITLPLPAIAVGAGNNIWAPTVRKLFALAQMQPQAGSTYSVEVDDGTMSLGKANFTIVR
jgi:hypothetical protein